MTTFINIVISKRHLTLLKRGIDTTITNEDWAPARKERQGTSLECLTMQARLSDFNPQGPGTPAKRKDPGGIL